MNWLAAGSSQISPGTHGIMFKYPWWLTFFLLLNLSISETAVSLGSETKLIVSAEVHLHDEKTGRSARIVLLVRLRGAWRMSADEASLEGDLEKPATPAAGEDNEESDSEESEITEMDEIVDPSKLVIIVRSDISLPSHVSKEYSNVHVAKTSRRTLALCS